MTGTLASLGLQIDEFQDLPLAGDVSLPVSVAETVPLLPAVRPHTVYLLSPLYSGEADRHNLFCLLEGMMSDMNPVGILISYPLVVSVWT
ncbi:hypothetical protein Celaphus_00011152 [Cervus elaphus hippelaphus]|uniref:Uncharacterized protein n=1 Tax=Cervus elaphus hippelaphus TaxID=46360 RepID=A0A212CRC8_CEREH|nr:hypothetical protein Celaphus_00011152 [Cervus elaphus hippelaphus]